MKTILRHSVAVMFLSMPLMLAAQSTNNQKQNTMETTTTAVATQYVLIDKITVPPTAKQEFLERMNYNRNLIKTLPGFIEDSVFERIDENGNIIVVTMAVWESQEAIDKAKAAVQADYKRQNVNLQEMLTRLGITMDRGIFKRVKS